MLDKILRIRRPSLDKTNTPMHIAVTIKGHYNWAKKNKKELSDVYREGFETVRKFISSQVELSVPIVTFYLLSENLPESEQFPIYTEQLISFLQSLKGSELLHKHKIKVSVLGKWYDLPGKIIEPIRNLIQETSDYDAFFVNFCINYNGQEEIVDACKLIARKVNSQKIEIDAIDKESIKDNLYCSAFLAPDVIIVSGQKNQLAGLLLWDSAYAKIFFTNKPWPEVTEKDFMEAIEFYQRK